LLIAQTHYSRKRRALINPCLPRSSISNILSTEGQWVVAKFLCALRYDFKADGFEEAICQREYMKKEWKKISDNLFQLCDFGVRGIDLTLARRGAKSIPHSGREADIANQYVSCFGSHKEDIRSIIRTIQIANMPKMSQDAEGCLSSIKFS
jgi:hypothetical protein